MESQSCPHCGTPNFTNLIVCYYGGRRLTTIAEAIPDDLPPYQSLPLEIAPLEVAPPIVSATSGFLSLFIAFFLSCILFVGILLLIWFCFLLTIMTGGFLFLPAIILIGCGERLLLFIPLIFQFFRNYSVIHGPQLWLRFHHWCDEVSEHFHKVHAGGI